MQAVSAIDPCNRTGKIVIPENFVISTRGSQDFLQGNVKDLSLCLLFQRGQCKAASKCHQIHADPTYVNHLRRRAAEGSTCCAAHGDPSSALYVNMKRMVTIVDSNGAPAVYPLSCFGLTQLLEQLLRSNQGMCRVSANKICRLHTQSRCKFGRDCKNIHLCREGQQNIPKPPVKAAQPVGFEAECTKLNMIVRAAVVRPTDCCDPLDIDDEESCGISTRSCSVFSTPGKASPTLAPLCPKVPVPLRLCAADLLLKPLTIVSPATAIFCSKGFESSIQSLCDDLMSSQFDSLVLTSPQW